MRKLDPLKNAGVAIDLTDGVFLGTCFAFRYPTTFLTAGHCVKPYRPEQVAVVLPASSSVRHRVSAVVTHDRADISILRVPSVSEDELTWPQTVLMDDHFWGQDYMACGYAEDYDAAGVGALPRVFQGNIQRFLEHTSHLGYQYHAAELSGRAPRGLSGAPVFHPGFHGRLFGLITENIRTTSELETVVDVEDEGKIYREHYHSVINYGIALWLPAISDWIDHHIPPVPHDEIVRRSENQHRLYEAIRGAI